MTAVSSANWNEWMGFKNLREKPNNNNDNNKIIIIKKVDYDYHKKSPRIL